MSWVVLTQETFDRIMAAVKAVENDGGSRQSGGFVGKRERGTGTIGPKIVKLIDSDGDAGDSESEAAFTYTIQSLDGDTIAEDVEMDGHGRRDPIGTMTPGTRGLAYRDTSGDEPVWKLLFADEQNETDQCDSTDDSAFFGF